MTIELAVKSHLAESVVKEIVQAALQSQAELARFRYEQFLKECAAFEHRFHMQSDDFLRRFDAGELGYSEDYFDWFAAVRGRNVWEQKAKVLTEVAA